VKGSSQLLATIAKFGPVTDATAVAAAAAAAADTSD